ncbi:carbohydrate kinase family protein [Rhizobiaceae bacterium BDR2-2]|uniref:Carbohydrate kinase family protein n=1 Tax=Ectorhizobium quercum TaxID=2965071 RepID=A0AAE3MZB0_9HYPH|nr:carbohydrate kinase family protein [Ectorhizobium quercum]MCX8997843.1 carbohydrate kinase family protein [Ectorhizobium quercum]
MRPRQNNHRILVLGGAHTDRRGRISGETVAGASNPGRFIVEPGGGAFNAARNLGLLGFSVRLISPRGGDADGEAVSAAAAACGVEDHPFIFLDRQTPSYTAILSEDGNLVIALADMELYRLFSPRRLKISAVRQAFEAADLVVCDANLPEETLSAIAAKARGLGTTLAAIAISPAKAVKLKPALAAFDLVFMNEAEAQVLSGARAASPEEWPALLRRAGLRGGAVTRGAGQIVAFDDTGTFLLTPPVAETVIDVTGAGDAFASGTLAGLLENLPLSQAIRRGAAAAAITIASPHAVAPDIGPELLETMVGLVPPAIVLA